jgi:hypothetical protein
MSLSGQKLFTNVKFFIQKRASRHKKKTIIWLEEEGFQQVIIELVNCKAVVDRWHQWEPIQPYLSLAQFYIISKHS